jgi:ABC-type phosphate/phosphonate transport system substrate-binding protein
MRRSQWSRVRFSVRRPSVPVCRPTGVEFPDQQAAVEAVRRGAVDVSASTAIGNRAFVERANDSTLAAVATTSRSARAPVGAFAVGKNLPDLMAALDDVIGRYLGTPTIWR